MNWVRNYLFFVVSSFAEIFLVSFVVWMAALLVLMFRELFSPEDLRVREYLFRVWRTLLLSFEFVAYSAVLISPIMMLLTRKYVEYGTTVCAALILSSVYLYIRKRTIGFRFKEKKKGAMKVND